MPTYTPVRMYIDQVPNSETTLYTVPGATSALLKEINIANVTGSPVTFQLSVVPSGDTAGADNRIIPSTSIPANSKVYYAFVTAMETGDFLSAIAGTASALTVEISGVTF